MAEIKQIYRDENTVKFSDGTSTLVIHKVIADPPEESFEAYSEWEDEE